MEGSVYPATPFLLGSVHDTEPKKRFTEVKRILNFFEGFVYFLRNRFKGLSSFQNRYSKILIFFSVLLKVNEVGHEHVPHDFCASSLVMLSTAVEQILREYS